jgi:hypothetical protein
VAFLALAYAVFTVIEKALDKDQRWKDHKKFMPLVWLLLAVIAVLAFGGAILKERKESSAKAAEHKLVEERYRKQLSSIEANLLLSDRLLHNILRMETRFKRVEFDLTCKVTAFDYSITNLIGSGLLSGQYLAGQDKGLIAYHEGTDLVVEIPTQDTCSTNWVAMGVSRPLACQLESLISNPWINLVFSGTNSVSTNHPPSLKLGLNSSPEFVRYFVNDNSFEIAWTFVADPVPYNDQTFASFSDLPQDGLRIILNDAGVVNFLMPLNLDSKFSHYPTICNIPTPSRTNHLDRLQHAMIYSINKEEQKAIQDISRHPEHLLKPPPGFKIPPPPALPSLFGEGRNGNKFVQTCVPIAGTLMIGDFAWHFDNMSPFTVTNRSFAEVIFDEESPLKDLFKFGY